MRPRSLALALPSLWALACGSSPPPVSPPPAASVAPVPSATAEPEGREAPDDPNAVRCGVDDRPRPVGEDDGPRPPAGAAERSMLGEPMPAPMPIERSARKVRPPTEAPLPPGLEVRLEQGPARGAGAGAPGALTSGLVGPAAPEACEPLAAVGDSGALELGVELASTAEPLRVRSSRPGAPSPYVRCLMERACQIKVSPGAGARRVLLPLVVEVKEPPPPPPPAQPERPATAIAVHADKGKDGDQLHRQAAVRVFSASGPCLQGQHLPAGKFKLRLDLERRDGPRGSFFGAPPPIFVGPMLSVVRVAGEGPIASEHKALARCLGTQLTGSSFPVNGQAPRTAKVRVEVVVLAVP